MQNRLLHLYFDSGRSTPETRLGGFFVTQIARLPSVEGVTMPSERAAFAFKANHPKGENALVDTACIEAMGCPLKYLIRQRLTNNSEKGKGCESYWLTFAMRGLSSGLTGGTPLSLLGG